MRSRQTPSADTFLVGASRDLCQAASERLASMGSVEVRDDAGGIVVHLPRQPTPRRHGRCSVSEWETPAQ